MKSKIVIEIETSKVPHVWDEGEEKRTKANSMKDDLEEDIHYGIFSIIDEALGELRIEKAWENGDIENDLWLMCEGFEKLGDYGNLKVTAKRDPETRGHKQGEKRVLLDIKATK